jgi:3-deoxy-D-manno-octulosonic-acid transferase
VIPRKPERFEEVAALIRARGFDCLRRSEHPDGVVFVAVGAVSDRDSNSEAVQTVILGDTMGELRRFYSLATVVFVGRSLVPMGGSDPMEAAALAKLVIAGPHMDNFLLPVDCLQVED